MSSKWGAQSVSQKSREHCPFCGIEGYSKEMPRHVEKFCKQAKAECVNKNVMDEFEKRRAKRKGCQDIGALLRSKPKAARTEEEGLLEENEMGDIEDGFNLELEMDPNANGQGQEY